jgi:hypothetical protein
MGLNYMTWCGFNQVKHRRRFYFFYAALCLIFSYHINIYRRIKSTKPPFYVNNLQRESQTLLSPYQRLQLLRKQNTGTCTVLIAQILYTRLDATLTRVTDGSFQQFIIQNYHTIQQYITNLVAEASLSDTKIDHSTHSQTITQRNTTERTPGGKCECIYRRPFSLILL